MLYVLGKNLPDNKSVKTGLNAIYGIGNKRSRMICDRLSINPEYRIRQLTDLQINLLINEIKHYTIDMDLKKIIKGNIDKLINIKCYRGLRHGHGLPVRGQRTRSNGRTQKSLSNKSGKTSLFKIKEKKSKIKEKKSIKKNKKK
jgi:small subunit ribosomal protein S13